MSLYCTEADLYTFGLPAGGLPNPGRLVQDISGTTPTTLLTLDGHGLALNAEVQFRAEAGGALPTGIGAGVKYYAIPVSGSTFSIAASSGGAAKNLTPPVTNVLVIQALPISTWIEWASNLVENFLPAHLVPLETDDNGDYPPVVVAVTADLAVARGLQWTGTGSVNLQDKIAAAQKMLDRWGKGVPLRGQGAAAQSPANLAITRSAAQVDPRGWTRPGGGLP